VNYFRGISSGVTLQGVFSLGPLMPAQSCCRSLIAFASLPSAAGRVPRSLRLAFRGGRSRGWSKKSSPCRSRSPASDRAGRYCSLYGGFSDFRRSVAFHRYGRSSYHAVHGGSVMAVFATSTLKTLTKARHRWRSPWRRFRYVIVPNAVPGILAGAAGGDTSLGDQSAWMLHTPLHKTLPIGLAASYASIG